MSKSLIADHPQQEAIDLALLLERETIKDMAKRFGVSPYVLSRRKKNLIATVEADSDGPQSEIEMWLDRADVEYQKAAGDDDRRGSCNAILAALRGLEAKSREQEREAESEQPPDGTVPPISIEQIDALMAAHDAWETDETRLIRAVVQEFESTLTYNANPVFFDLVERMFRERMFDSHLADSQLLARFMQYAQTRISEGSRHDLPRKQRKTDELFSQVAN